MLHELESSLFSERNIIIFRHLLVTANTFDRTPHQIAALTSLVQKIVYRGLNNMLEAEFVSRERFWPSQRIIRPISIPAARQKPDRTDFYTTTDIGNEAFESIIDSRLEFYEQISADIGALASNQERDELTD